MNTNALLTESLEASITLEVNRKHLMRAAALLVIAQKAFKRYTEWAMNVESYERAHAKLEPWTILNTKERTLKRAADALAAYHRCMNSYRKILFVLFTNKN